MIERGDLLYALESDGNEGCEVTFVEPSSKIVIHQRNQNLIPRVQKKNEDVCHLKTTIG